MRPYVVALACFSVACPAADLEQRLDALTADTLALGFTGIQVVEAATGKILYSKSADRLFLPASNLKILTSALALERLRPDYRFTTRVVREASGDLVLVGSGDPSLSGRAFPYSKESRAIPPLQAIEQLADAIAAHGVQRIDGDIVGDDRLFPWDPYPASWTEDDTLRDFGAPVSALTRERQHGHHFALLCGPHHRTSLRVPNHRQSRKDGSARQRLGRARAPSSAIHPMAAHRRHSIGPHRD